jgi:hypothetical protein
MLGRLDELLGRRLVDLELRIEELSSLRDEIRRYQSRVRQRIGDPGEEAARAVSAGDGKGEG